jgi:hypothetical protein
MTLLAIKETIRLLIGSPLPSVIRDPTPAAEGENLRKYINAAQDEMASHTGGVEANGGIVLELGVRLYDLPDGFLAESEVRYVADEGYEKLLLKTNRLELSYDYQTFSGEPVYFYYENSKMGFYPVPGDREDGKQVAVYGWFEPADLVADADIPSFHPSHHRLIAVLSVVLILEAQARFEAQSANSAISADSVSQESRTKEYAFRAADFRSLYEKELYRIRGPKV